MFGIIDIESKLNIADLSSKLDININTNEESVGIYFFADKIATVDNLILCFDGVIYNYKKLNNLLINAINNLDDNGLLEKFESNLIGISKDNIGSDGVKSKYSINVVNDFDVLSNLVYYYYLLTDDLLAAVNSTILILDGDYAFSIYDGTNLALCRDDVGVKPMFCGLNRENNIPIFSSDKITLWKFGVLDKDILDLKPGDIVYNWQIYENKESLLNLILDMDLIDYDERYDNYSEYQNTKESFDIYKELLFANLIESVYTRVDGLDKVGMIFSGGVDSSILASILKEISIQREKPLDFKLFSVGIEGSQDLKFSRKIADELGLELEEILIDEELIRRYLKDVLIAIEDANIMKLGVGMTMFIASKFMAEEGYNVAIAGQGADELFGGYNRYLKHFENNDLSLAYFALDSEIRHDIENMYHVNLERDNACTIVNGVELRSPFLDKKLIRLAIDCPASFKIRNNEDILRKYILREVARDFDLPDYIVERPKKAAQYGSGINKILKNKVLKGFGIEEFINSLKN